MKNLFLLFKGELFRLLKYKIMWFGIGLSLIWILILSLSAQTEAKALMPYLLVMDTGMMAIILLSSSFYYEKQENTIKSVFVSPILVGQILFAKILSSLVMSVGSIILVGLTMLIVHGVFINYALAIIYVILSTLAHIAIGYIIVFYSIDFTSFLIKYMGVVLLLMLPTLLVMLNLVNSLGEYFALLSPSYAVQFLIGSLFEKADIWKMVISICALVTISAVLYPLVVYPKFKAFAIRG